MTERLESPAPVIVLLGAAIGYLALLDVHRRRVEEARARAFNRQAAELEAANERADAAEAAEQALRRAKPPQHHGAVPEPPEREPEAPE